MDPSQPGARLLPKSPLGKAVRYALAEWEAVSRYLEAGHYEIDNNQTRMPFNPPVSGKAWMFIGHPDPCLRSAVIYSLLISARRRGYDPATYLSDVLRRIPSIKVTDLDTLLPANWKPLTPWSLILLQIARTYPAPVPPSSARMGFGVRLPLTEIGAGPKTALA